MKIESRSNIVPPGTYHAEYLQGKMIETPNGHSDRAYLMAFRVIGGNSDGMEVSRLVNPEAKSTRSNIVRYFAMLAGGGVENDLKLDDSDYVGAQYEICVTKNDSGDYTRFEAPIRRLAEGEVADSSQFEVPF